MANLYILRSGDLVGRGCDSGGEQLSVGLGTCSEWGWDNHRACIPGCPMGLVRAYGGRAQEMESNAGRAGEKGAASGCVKWEKDMNVAGIVKGATAV